MENDPIPLGHTRTNDRDFVQEQNFWMNPPRECIENAISLVKEMEKANIEIPEAFSVGTGFVNFRWGKKVILNQLQNPEGFYWCCYTPGICKNKIGKEIIDFLIEHLS